MPAMKLTFGPPGRPAMPYKANNRYISPQANEFRKEKAFEERRQSARHSPSRPRSGLAAETMHLRDAFHDAASKTGNGQSTGSKGTALPKTGSTNSKDGKGRHKR